MIDFVSGHIPDPRDTSFTEDLEKVQQPEVLLRKRIAELEREASVAHGAVDFWQTAENEKSRRVSELEAQLDQALNMLVVEGLDAQFIDGVGWTFGRTGALTIPAGAKDRLLKMLSEGGGG